MKLIYTPFPATKAGNLASVLAKRPDAAKGFENNQRIYAPKRNDDNYIKSEAQPLDLSDGDELLINAHCNAGLDYLSTNVKCETDKDVEKKVTASQLVLQLAAHGLKKERNVKIKLWVCKGGQDGAFDKESFAKRFSKAMFEAGYQSCRIFAYTESLMQQYGSIDTEDPHEKGVHRRSNNEKKQFDDYIEKLKTNPETPQNRTLKRLLAISKSEEDAKSKLRPLWESTRDHAVVTPGLRASNFRKEFRDGKIVDHVSTTD
ncbi:hypothetical protein [Paraburkholderia hospita]|uniref:Uncharacterized protein n=1 Tax=Paraburkholderia hospita TaxID=169430 RepID=A0AAN1JCF8_9BURK|nr:hypothetical protein [Paraburkholderia hospita]AUT71421.1 hypothetical protein C2L64_24420 [Paraburkholderia hospita]EIM94321.1 hypothetical protein WQE_45283 [Paraburkholderia hospita]OUL68489.1 hypothetical protein CA601_51390 [Paraburkholderia hospita]OUL74322.1 hypothetical protein CA602_39245 [Paraburkholderia hospita]SEI02880.1 hypothetical protein SAMN05192544_1016105 [Paraburkholderia hospita]